MPETDLGVIYPDSSGHTRIWEHLQTLAATATAAIRDALAALQEAAGRTTVSLNNAASGSTAVTFPANRFTAAPAVTATINASSTTYVAGTGPSSVTGVTIIAFHRTGAASTANLTVSWIARSIR